MGHDGINDFSGQILHVHLNIRNVHAINKSVAAVFSSTLFIPDYFSR